MKRFLFLIGGCLAVASVMSQTTALSITTEKTTSLVFPFSIRHVDRGTKEILAQQVKEADNILLVKASVKNFTETNLSVVTDDGNVYAFNVTYDPNPSIWVYNLPVNKKATVTSYSNGILDNPPNAKRIKDKAWKISSTITGLYTNDNISFFQIELTNSSSMNYDIDILRFYIKDNKKGKRAAIQENELKPLYIAGNYKQVKAHQKTVIVVALDRFTIPDAKYLAIQIMEKNGGRHLLMKVKNKKLMKAEPLPDLR